MFDDFDVQIQSDEIIPEEYEDWLQSIEVTPEEFEADMRAFEEMEAEEIRADLEAQDRWYHETFE